VVIVHLYSAIFLEERLSPFHNNGYVLFMLAVMSDDLILESVPV
jgi:hypothetical protein